MNYYYLFFILLFLFIIIFIYYPKRENFQCNTLRKRLLCTIRCRDVQDLTRKWQCLTYCCSPV